MWQITRYDRSEHRELWDVFVNASRNSTFLFLRDYMDYHADRFTDHSLLFYRNGLLAAILPANITADGVLHSHQGLTYGGLVLPPRHIDGADVLGMMTSLAGYCRSQGIRQLDYKPLPFIYATYPSQEDLYALFRLGAVVSVTNLSSALSPRHNPGLTSLRRRHLKKAAGAGFRLSETTDTDQFWQLLDECLHERHGAAPLHTSGELKALKSKFPDRIRIFTACNHDGKLIAGVCVYDSDEVAHCQYIASNREGRESNALTPLFHWLISDIFAGRRYFDFGTSNEDAGQVLNAGLLHNKFSYGATGVAYQQYRLTFS